MSSSPPRRTLSPSAPKAPERQATVPAMRAVLGADAAEAPRLAVTIVDGRGAPLQSIEVDGDFIRIGANSSNDVVVDDPLVSRFHCVLRRFGERWRVEDAGSLNGTRLGAVWVRDADLPLPEAVLEIGSTVLRVRTLSAARKVRMASQADFGPLHGRSHSMRKLFADIERVAKSDVNVLIEGETGTGKELVATEVVRRGARADKPLVIVDCGAISPNLAESALFGHKRGAFTGADRDHVGSFEAAHGGTLFLDELGELPLDLQPKLLRAIESRSVSRLGENHRRPVDVRIVAATNRRLDGEVNNGRFREDLYFRLSVVTLRIPPLRERIEDLDLLVASILEAMGNPEAMATFTPDVLENMAQHAWPGNVRELRNYVERMLVMDEPTPAATSRAATSPNSGLQVVANVDLDVPLRTAKERLVASFESKYIAELLAWAEGNVSRASRRAGMDRINLHRLIQRYQLRDAPSGKRR